MNARTCAQKKNNTEKSRKPKEQGSDALHARASSALPPAHGMTRRGVQGCPREVLHRVASRAAACHGSAAVEAKGQMAAWCFFVPFERERVSK